MRIFNLVLTAFSISLTFSQDYEKKVFIRNNDSLPYRILLPENYNPEITYPLIMFLHGAGERGNDNYKQLVHGSILFKSEAFRKQYPAITIFHHSTKLFIRILFSLWESSFEGFLYALKLIKLLVLRSYVRI